VVARRRHDVLVADHRGADRRHRVRSLQIHSRTLGPLEAGDEEPTDVVLVHGLGMSSRYMQPLMVRLAGRYRVHTPDLPGSGQSDRPAAPLTLLDRSQILGEWMETAGIARAALVGHSLGCVIAAYLALEHPDRVSCLVLVSPSPDPERRHVWQQLGSLMLDSLQEPLSLVWLTVKDYRRAGMMQIVRTLRDSIRTMLWELRTVSRNSGRLRQVGQPTLVVHAGRDRVVSQQWARTVSRLLPAGHLVRIRGATHAVNYSAPDTLAATIEPFLDHHAGRTEDASPADG
jgi:pimeloyl-ACP methyl ester carboxylesterase